MSWFSNIMPQLISRVWGSKDFQQGFQDMLTGLAAKLIQHKNDPSMIQHIAQDIQNNPQAIIGAVAAGTNAEELVKPEAIHAAEQITANNSAPDRA